jgi:GGDEF domain-containing protein
LGAYAFFAEILRRRLGASQQWAAVCALIDGVALALLLAATGNLENFALSILLPALAAARRYRADVAFTVPIVVGASLAAQLLFASGNWSAPFLAQCALVLGMGLLIPRPVADGEEHRLSLPQTPVLPVPDQLEIRERFRRLKSYARELESRVGRDRWVTVLYEAKDNGSGRLTPRLAKTLRDHSGAAAVSIHLVDESRLVMAAGAGRLEETVRRMAFNLTAGLSDQMIEDRIHASLSALADEHQRQHSASVFLRHRGDLIGMVNVYHSDPEQLASARARVELAKPVLVALITDERRCQGLRRRLAETETLYGVATLVAGSETIENVLRRVVRNLSPEWDIDGMGVYRLVDGAYEPIEAAGSPLLLFDCMSFATGPGVGGWSKLGRPELYIPDTDDDQRVDSRTALKLRIGSFAALPIHDEFFLAVSCHSTFGISREAMASLRMIAAELESAIYRLEGNRTASGLSHPTEFFQLVAEASEGWLCYLEPLRRDELIDRVGRPAYDRALRQLSIKLRMVLPPGGIICRRDEGDFVAFLPGADAETAQSYLNEASATAAMLALRTPDGKQRIPLALRGRRAEVAKREQTAA